MNTQTTFSPFDDSFFYIHLFSALSPFIHWPRHRVLNDFLSAKVASPYDMESTAMLFQKKVLTDAPRIFC